MAVGEASRSSGRKVDEGSSVIDKRRYGRSRKKRIRPADTADEPPSPLPAPSSTANVTVPQQPTSSTTAPAFALPRPDSEAPPTPSSCPSPSSSSSDSTATSATNQPSFRKSSSTTTSQRSGAPPTTTPREERPKSSSGKYGRHCQRRGNGAGRRSDGDSTRGTQASNRSSRGSDSHKTSSLSRRRGRLRRSSSSRFSRGSSSASDLLSQPPGTAPVTSSTINGGGYSTSGGAATSSEERGHGRYQHRNDRHESRPSYSKRRSKRREGSSEHDRLRSHRRAKTRQSYTLRREERSSEPRRSKGERNDNTKKSSDVREGGQDKRHCSDHQFHRRHHHRYRRHRRSNSSNGGSGGSSGRGSGSGSSSSGRRRSRSSSSSSSSSSIKQYRSQDKRGGPPARRDRTQRGSGQKRRHKNVRNHSRGRHRGHSRADNSATERRHTRAGTEGEADSVKHVAAKNAKNAADKNLPEKLTKTVDVAREDSKPDVLNRRGELRRINLEAVVRVQCLFRGCMARNRVAGRREALAFLRSSCFGVTIDLIDAYIREDVAPRMIHGILGKGYEGGETGAAQRAEAVAAANTLLEETSASLIRELVALGLTEEANDHLDAVFVRDRRNPLLVTVDDIIAEALRKWMREVVVEVVKEGAGDFLFDRRISELVDDVIEEGMVEAVRPVAAEVYHSAIAFAAFSKVEEELCAEEAKLVVAETMAPFEDQLVELQREKDVAAIQAAAHHVMIKGLQLQHAARTIGQRGRLVLMSDINGKTLNLLLAGRFLAILRAAETNCQQVSTSPLLFMLFRRLVVRTGRSVLLEELGRELDRDESALHALELERIDELDRHRRRAGRDRSTP